MPLIGSLEEPSLLTAGVLLLFFSISDNNSDHLEPLPVLLPTWTIFLWLISLCLPHCWKVSITNNSECIWPVFWYDYSCTSTAIFELLKHYSVFISDKVSSSTCYFLDFIWPILIIYFPFKLYNKLC